MKQTLYVLVVLSGLSNSVYAMEEVADDGVEVPKGLLSCCIRSNRSANTLAADTGLKLQRQDGRCPGCTVDEIVENEKKTGKRVVAQEQSSKNTEALATAALFHGVVNNNLTCILRHLAEGADVNAQDEAGYTSIEYAICDRNTEAVAILLAVEGIDIAKVTAQGKTLDQLIEDKKDGATELQLNDCDELLLYLKAKREGVFPYSVQEHRLVYPTENKMLLSAMSMDGARLKGRASVELALLLRDIMEKKQSQVAAQSGDEALE